jgi:cytochrome c oxidase subunit 2
MRGRILAVAGALAAAGCEGVQSALDPAGPQAGRIAWVTWWFFGVCGVVYLLTLAALGWALFRRRRPEDQAPETTRRLTTVVTGATAVTALTLIVLTIFSVTAQRGLAALPAPGAITIDVVGHQWWWEFQYRDASPNEWVNSPNELHIPVGVPVAVRAMSRDVIHSFWVPNLHGKRDLIPGIVTHTWIQADRPGVYRGQCAEFCGHQHANMAFVTVAEPMDQFLMWLQQQRRGAPQPATDVQKRGHQLFMTGPCVMCHAIRGTPAGSRIGPDLTHVASRRTLASGTLPNTREHLARWIVDSQEIKPGNRMPPTPMSREDLDALLAYLETLR